MFSSDSKRILDERLLVHRWKHNTAADYTKKGYIVFHLCVIIIKTAMRYVQAKRIWISARKNNKAYMHSHFIPITNSSWNTYKQQGNHLDGCIAYGHSFMVIVIKKNKSLCKSNDEHWPVTAFLSDLLLVSYQVWHKGNINVMR